MPRTLEVSAYRMRPLAEVGLVHWCVQEDMACLPFLRFSKGGRKCLHKILQLKLNPADEVYPLYVPKA